jgi:hypothetical protein
VISSAARHATICLALLFTLPLAGCQWSKISALAGPALTVTSEQQKSPTALRDFDIALYRFDQDNALTAVLLQGSADQPTQAVTIRMFWRPRAGSTPLDRTATNATIQYAVFTGENVGVYSGAGFLYPQNTPGNDSLTAAIWQAILRPADQSLGYEDPLGKATVKGKFTVRRDDIAVEQLLRKLNVHISERLGYPRLVDGEDKASAPAF